MVIPKPKRNEDEKGQYIMTTRKKNPVSPLKKKGVTRNSQRERTTKDGKKTKRPSQRLIKRRTKTAEGPRGYFANPIKGRKAAQFFAVYTEQDGKRFYYAGSDAKTGAPVFDSDVKKAMISGNKTLLKNHMSAETAAHIHRKGLKLYMIKVLVDGERGVIPSE